MAITSLFGPTPAEIMLSQQKEAQQEQLLRNQMIAQQGAEFGPFRGLYQAGLRFGDIGAQAMRQGLFPQQADPRLQEATAVQSVLAKYANEDQTDPNVLARIGRDLMPIAPNAGIRALTLAEQFKPKASEQKVVPPGAAVLDSKGNVIFQNPKETAQNIKTVDLGDRIEYYQGDSKTPFKTERKGEAPTTQFKRELEASKREEKESKQEVAAQSSIAHATKVLQDVSETKNLVGPLTTGGAGGLLRFLPQTDARKLGNKIQTIKANLGFDRLQQMREASPTGGALGQVAVQEINFLQSVVATLDQLESQNDILNALGKIEEHYSNWLNAVKGRMPSAQRTPSAAEVPTAATTVVPSAATGLPAGVTVKKVK